jgi:hypothetical protein
MSTTAPTPVTTPIPVQLSNQSSPHLSCRTSRCPSEVQSANWATIGSSILSCGSSTRGCNGSACLCRKMPMANQPSITRPSTKSLPNGPTMAHSGRRSSRACGISRLRNTSTPGCSMATGPIPWPKKGGWHWLLGLQTPAGREGHCHHRQSWLRLSACPRGSRQ